MDELFDMSYSETLDEPTSGCYICTNYSNEGCTLGDETQSFDALDVDPVKGCRKQSVEMEE